MSIGKVIGYLVSAVLVFLGLVFLIASAYIGSRLLVGAILTAVGFGIAVLVWRSGAAQVPVKYEIEAPGSLSAESIKCSNCGASLDSSKLKLRQGVPVIKCPYCDNEFEIVEKPKW